MCHEVSGDVSLTTHFTDFGERHRFTTEERKAPAYPAALLRWDPGEASQPIAAAAPGQRAWGSGSSHFPAGVEN